MEAKRPALVLAVIVAAAAGLAWTMTVGSAPDTQDPAPVTLTGCLRSGSAATVFILRGAAASGPTDAPSQEATSRDYLLVEVAEGIDLNAHLNQRVAITGPSRRASDGPAPPEAANTAERALWRLSVQGLRHVANDCSTLTGTTSVEARADGIGPLGDLPQ